ncbi:MAG: hypothetical protein NTW21_26000 [Verrucomicrobia bacterium]|nr:hypothetical protein [Verrucomicrobiota bacterium]
MSAKPSAKVRRSINTPAPTGRKITAQGKALGKATPMIPSPEGAKQGGELPRGWTETTFGAVVAAVSVNDKKLPRGSYLESGRFPVVDQGQQFIGGYSNDESRVISSDLPLLVFGDHTRAFKFLNQPFVPGADGVKVLKPLGVDAKWLYEIAHALEFPDKGYARHYQHLKSAKLFVPPLPEQRRIVAELEKQFTRLEAGMAALRRVQANLKRYHAAVLKAACEGTRVPTEAELQMSKARGQKSKARYETGAELLARILTERRQDWQGRSQYKEPTALDTAKLFPLPAGWTWMTLDALAEIKGGITKDQNRKHTAPARSVPYLRVANVQWGYIELTEVKEIVTTEDEIQELALKPGDILFNEGGDRDKLGRGWVWNGELPECIHQNRVFRTRLYVAALSPKLVSWYANTFGQQFFFDEGKHTTNLASISMSKLKGLPVPIPPPAEQTRIVAEVARRLSVVEELEAVVSANLQHATRLRQSILQKAFTGGLISEPDGPMLHRDPREGQNQIFR